MFRWTPTRLARVRSAVRAYNRAITMRARKLESEGRSDLVNRLPKRETVAGVMSEIHDVNDFRRIVGYRNDARRGRTSRLTRILKSVRPDALEFDGAFTRYEKREHENDQRAIRRIRERTARDVETPLYEGDEGIPLDDISFSDNDLMPEDAGEPDDTVEDVDPDTRERWRHEDDRAKRDKVRVDVMYLVYRDTWTHPLNMHDVMPGYQALLDALDWLAHNRPDVLNKEFAKSPDELDPAYITESGGISNPYTNIPYETRHNRAVRYLTDVAERAGWHS